MATEALLTPNRRRRYVAENELVLGTRSEEHIEKVLSKLEGAYSPHTLAAYRADYLRFKRWCALTGARAFPASPSTLVGFVRMLGPTLKITTIRRMIITLRRLHQLACVADPTVHIDVILAVRTIARSQVERPQQALGITLELRDRLMGACEDNLSGIRDRALLAVGFETLCRSSEIVALNIEDLQPTKPGAGSLVIARGKTDYSGFGRMVVLSQQTTQLLKRWLGEANVGQGAVFRPVYHTSALDRRLMPRAVGRILKARAEQAGLIAEQIKQISGHSLRVGGAQQLTIDGRDLVQVMRAGGWRSVTTVSRYIENAEISLWE